MTARQPADALHEDPGLQPERTSLSWTRTSLSLMVVAATMVRHAAQFPAVIFVLAAITLGLALIIVLGGRPRYERGALGLADGALEPNIVPVVVITLCLAGLGVTELAMILPDRFEV